MITILNPHVRVGKIARLPDDLRNELNHRLCNNEPGLRLLEWLNTLPQVQAILARDFAGRPINSVNLTHWKLGGYREWMFRRELILTTLEAKSGVCSRIPQDDPNWQHELQIVATAQAPKIRPPSRRNQTRIRPKSNESNRF